ncbi:MAG TPA: hypothetical protein VKT83_18020 [bacterium]|nr:hypothetical protein [bacterium]
MKDPKTIAVYVRKGEADERVLSFRISEDLPQEELLAHGFALDGNTALRSVPKTSPEGTFTERLYKAQAETVTWLAKRGYRVEFK